MENKRFSDFCTAYNFLENHEMCQSKSYIGGKVSRYTTNYFYRCLDITVVKVNPENLVIEDNEDLNTKTQVWLEFGKAFLNTDDSEHVQFEHDMRLDCSGDTFEEAIINLSNLVDKYYLDNGAEKQGVKYEDLNIEFSQSLATDDKNLLLTKIKITNKYDQYIDIITTVFDREKGDTICNDIEYSHDWETIIEG